MSWLSPPEAVLGGTEMLVRAQARVSALGRAALAIGASLGAFALAGPACSATLGDALVSTYLRNPDLEAGRAELRGTDELVRQALAGYRPTVTLDGDVEGVAGEAEVGGGDSDPDRLGRGVALTMRQNLYAGGGTAAAVNRAENSVRAQRSELVALEQDVLGNAVEAYTALWRDRAALELALANLERLERQLRATRDRLQVGEATRTDVAQAEARVAQARSDVASARAELAVAGPAYKRVVGTEPPQELAPAAPIGPEGLPSTLEEALAMTTRNPTVLVAEHRLAAARDAVAAARAGLLPSLDLRGRAAYDDDPSTFIERERSATLGLTLSIPLYQGGAAYSRVRQATQDVVRAESRLESARHAAQEAASAGWDRLVAARVAIEALEAEVRANRAALEGVQEEAVAGGRTVLDVLDAQQELFVSEVDLVRAQREGIAASYDLKAAIGGMDVASLGLEVEPYDPKAYHARQPRR